MKVERTLAIIKPDAWPQHGGEIITMATKAGLVPVEAKVVQIPAYVGEGRSTPPATWEEFYVEHHGKHFFESLVKFMASGPALVMVLEGEDAIKRWRALIGPSDSRKARDTLRGATETVRGKFGAPAHFLTTKSTGRKSGSIGEYPMWQNAVHGSDSPEAAACEIAFFFGGA